MKEQIAEIADRHRRNNLRFIDIKEKSGVESKKWEVSETKVKVFLQEKWVQILTKSLLRKHIGSERKNREKEGPSYQNI